MDYCPLILLSLGALLAVTFGWPESFGGHNTIASWLHSAINYGQSAEPEAHPLQPTLAWTLALISTVLSLVSAGIAWKLYGKGLGWEESFEKSFLEPTRSFEKNILLIKV